MQTDKGIPLPNLYAIGLAVGPAPTADMGGECDFHGQVNSLWMWQHVLGLRIVEGALRSLPTPHKLQDLTSPAFERTKASDSLLLSLQSTESPAMIGTLP